MPEWTKEQKLAIDGRNGSLLVSAAAGSGKTTVLVERVIQRLTDTVNRCPADKLVIVTFTRAAAAQMKERIEAALEKRIAQGADPWLMQQQLLLQSAKISTIDSFCADLVRENFQSLGISADFSVSDDGENARFSEMAIREVYAQMYSSGRADFRLLSDTLSTGGNDVGLTEAIKTIYQTVSSYPFPADETDRLIAPYFSDEPVENSVWGSFMLDEAVQKLEYCLALMSDAEKLITDINADPDTVAAVDELVAEEKQMYTALLEIASAKKWDELYFALHSLSFAPFTRKRKLDVELKNAVKLRRDKAKDTVVDLSEKICCTSAAFEADRAALRPVAAAFADCVKLYIQNLFEIKKQEEKFDFNDIEHLALELLVEKDTDGNIRKTPLAQLLSSSYAEIMVDEYQDTNELQDMIFSAVSDNESNLFFVGDVKQSIYRFRQAMPEIFLKRRDRVPEFDGENYPAKVTLGANFRSRNSITNAVNFLFERLMSERTGEICYNENERLNAKASYPEGTGPDIEFCLRADSRGATEPEFVASYVKNLLDSGRMIKDGDVQRPIRPGDVCILTRFNKRMSRYAQALENIGIPAMSVIDGQLGTSAEVRVMVSLLTVLDNPLQDIPLTAVMMSPVFGFTADELASIRIGVKGNVPVYRSVLAAAENGNEKCRRFLERIDMIRLISIGSGAAEFLRRLYTETDILSVAQAMDNPEQRVANLWSLLDRATAFDSSGGCGLSAFLRFLNKGDKNGTQVDISDGADAVKVMTVHKSKGLEFGVCILVELSENLRHVQKGNMSFSRSYGMGFTLRDKFSGKSFKTLPYIACGLETSLKELSEEVRVLYVALTRAKEQLVFIGSCSKPEEKLKAIPLAFPSDDSRMDYGYTSSSSTNLDFLLPVYGRHMQACEFYSRIGVYPDNFILKPDFDLKAVLCDESDNEEVTEDLSEEILESFAPDEDLALQIKARMDYEYPYAALSSAVSKKQASGFLDERFDESFFASSRPAFMNKGGLTAAQKGTLTHKFMQLCDLKNSDVKSQLAAMVADGSFTIEEAKELKTDEVEAFYSSELCKRINASSNIMREKKFAMLMSVTEVYPELTETFANETIVVQGMLDLAFEENGEIVIVDYKTDRGVGEDELRERHFEQLQVYSKAIERCTDYRVKAAYVYSLALKKEIKML